MPLINATGYHHRAFTASTARTYSAPFLIFGFAATLVLVSILVTLSLRHLQSTHNSIMSLAEEHSVKSNLVRKMYNAARDRTMHLFAMVNDSDPFQQDEQFQKFTALSGVFADSRTHLMKMKLTPEERNLVELQGEQTRATIPYQDQVVEMVQQRNIKRAHEILMSAAVPYQDKVLATLERLIDLQDEATNIIAQQSKATQQQAYVMIFSIAALTLVLALVIAIFISRRIIHTERALNYGKKLAEVTLRSIGEAVITTDAIGHVQYLNPLAERLTAWSIPQAEDVKLSRVLSVMDGETEHNMDNVVSYVLENHARITSPENAILNNRANQSYAIEYTAAPILDENELLHGAIVVFRDVTEMRSMAYQLSYQASHDALTGLLNRHEFEVRLQHAISNARTEHIQHALCYLDMDQFKVINDTCGHIAGDEVLKQLSQHLKDHVRENDSLARLGGDEFGILLEGCDIAYAEEIVEKIRRTVNEIRFIWNNKPFDLSVSIGVAPINMISGNVSDVMSAADTACYEAKDQGRNRIHIYHPDDENMAKRQGEMHWVHRINEALDNDQIELHFQEIFALQTDRLGHRYCEALVRLRDEQGQLVPPMAFIPAAERYNLMPAIDKRVLKQSLTHITTLNKRGISLYVSINLSGQSICDNEFLNYIVEEIVISGVDASHLIFEITETAAIANFNRALHFIKTLKELGCKFALDDFGSGLSSFAYLKNLPVDFLKIDGTFVRDIINDPKNAAFVESINQIGSIMGIKTIAEYVENQDILDKLVSIGVHYAQGFHIGKPAPIDTFSFITPVTAKRD